MDRNTCVYDRLKIHKNFFRVLIKRLKNFQAKISKKKLFFKFLTKKSSNLVNLQSSVYIGKCAIVQHDGNTILMNQVRNLINIFYHKCKNFFLTILLSVFLHQLQSINQAKIIFVPIFLRILKIFRKIQFLI